VGAWLPAAPLPTRLHSHVLSASPSRTTSSHGPGRRDVLSTRSRRLRRNVDRPGERADRVDADRRSGRIPQRHCARERLGRVRGADVYGDRQHTHSGTVDYQRTCHHRYAGLPYAYDVDATDPDAGDVLTYSLTTAPAGMSVNPTSGLIAWTPTSLRSDHMTSWCA